MDALLHTKDLGNGDVPFAPEKDASAEWKLQKSRTGNLLLKERRNTAAGVVLVWQL
jgi:hypothetical protein